MATRLTFRSAIIAVATITALAVAHAQQKAPDMKIRIVTGDRFAVAELDDNATARAFVALLPLRLVLTDYAATEKIADLPGKLTTAGSPPGFAPKAGAVTYYAPWGNLAIFVKDFSHSAGLVELGRITSGLEIIGRPGPVPVIIERATD
ncbi:cyclophilin-like fold protein [Pinisolibacter sp.]|uniref:cyclophilin-like fold protein n=1 Tax=Pinisolibacter sp. TaxID=2172024 RepID=UPI002FDE89F5